MFRKKQLHSAMQPVAVLVHDGNSRPVGINATAGWFVYRILVTGKMVQVLAGRQVKTEDAQEEINAYL